MTTKNDFFDGGDANAIYTCLGSISSGGRKYLKVVAQSLLDLQNDPKQFKDDYISHNSEINQIDLAEYNFQSYKKSSQKRRKT